MNLAVCCPSTGNHEAAVDSWINRASRTWAGASPRIDWDKDGRQNTRTVEWDSFLITVDDTIEGIGAGYLHKVEKFYRENTADVLAYLHSDLYIQHALSSSQIWWTQKSMVSEFLSRATWPLWIVSASSCGVRFWT